MCLAVSSTGGGRGCRPPSHRLPAASILMHDTWPVKIAGIAGPVTGGPTLSEIPADLFACAIVERCAEQHHELPET